LYGFKSVTKKGGLRKKMSRLIDEECRDCDDYIHLYGCTNHECPIRKDYDEGMESMAADFDHDKRREERMMGE